MESRYTFGGDEYVFVEFAVEMSLEANFKVLAVSQEVRRYELPGVIEVCPGNTSYLVHFRPEEIAPRALVGCLREAEQAARSLISIRSRLVDIPVLYDDPWTRECAARFADRHQDPSATNLEYVMRLNGFGSKADLIAAHSRAPHWVAMVCFVPGAAACFQMVARERAIQTPKYLRPRTDTPERAVGLGGVFSCIYPVRGPGGYQLLGISAVPVYDPGGALADLRERFILPQAGDRWKFRPVDVAEYEAVRSEVEAGTYRYRMAEQDFVPMDYFADPERYLQRLQAEAEERWG